MPEHSKRTSHHTRPHVARHTRVRDPQHRQAHRLTRACYTAVRSASTHPSLTEFCNLDTYHLHHHRQQKGHKRHPSLWHEERDLGLCRAERVRQLLQRHRAAEPNTLPLQATLYVHAALAHGTTIKQRLHSAATATTTHVTSNHTLGQLCNLLTRLRIRRASRPRQLTAATVPQVR